MDGVGGERPSEIARPTPRRLGRYVLRYEIAHGGMATVYLAQLAGARGFGKWVAIKWVHPHLAKDKRFVRMLIDEARTTAQIDHPAVCQVLDFVEDNGTAYIVMEYLHGESLVSVLRRARENGGLSIALAVRIAVQVARGLHTAHEARGPDGVPLEVVHRDVSPQNIHVLYSGSAKVLDFGIAKARERSVEATATDELKGKPAYMAPEQVLTPDHDRRADIWALGVVIWEMIAQRRLFRCGNDAQTLLHVLHDEVPKPSQYRPEVSPALDAAILKALERDLSKRFQTCAELADALESAMLERKEVATESDLAALMEANHGEVRKLRESLLRARFSEGAGVLAIDLHGHATQAGSTPTRDQQTGETAFARPASRRKTQLRYAALAVGALALPVMGWLLMTTPPPDAPLPAQPRAQTTAPMHVDVVEGDVTLPPVIEPPAPPPDPHVVSAPPPIAITPRGPSSPPSAERRLPPGRINVLAVPAAEVWFHGALLGSTPLVGRELPAGRQRVEIRWGEQRRAVPVRVRSGELTTLSVRRDE